jgi:hypothetical protein
MQIQLSYTKPSAFGCLFSCKRGLRFYPRLVQDSSECLQTANEVAALPAIHHNWPVSTRIVHEASTAAADPGMSTGKVYLVILSPNTNK